MEDFVEDEDYAIYFVHQEDARPFNRGAIKNIGFIAMRTMYPDAYKDIVFVFHDVDVMAYQKGLITYGAEHGTITHHYGFRFALGGIMAITGADFERINGFANYWTWGFEDNLLQNRAQRAGIRIDRTNFFELNDMRILHINDGNTKMLNRKYMYELVQDSGDNGIKTISNLNYTVDKDARAIRVTCFDVEYSPWQGRFEEYDLRNGRDIHAPITKDMILSNAKKGNHLETLFFINEKGERQGTHELLEQENRENREKQEKLEKREMRRVTTHQPSRGLLMAGIKQNEKNLQAKRHAEFIRGRKHAMRPMNFIRK